jgi:hypothetical protein
MVIKKQGSGFKDQDFKLVAKFKYYVHCER